MHAGLMRSAGVALCLALAAAPVAADPAAAPIWSGVYAGIHAGAGHTSVDAINNGFGRFDKFDVDGAVLGGHVGYNHQWGNWVAGVEADASWSAMSGRQAVTYLDPRITGTVGLDADWMATARVRLGYAAGNALLFATAGYTIAEMTATTSAQGLGLRFSRSTSDTFDGFVIGAGLDYRVSHALSARFEGLLHRFTDDGESNSVGVIRAGLTYHLPTLR